MKEKIEGILEIDKKTQDIVERTDAKIEEEKTNLRETLTKMEKDSNEKAKITAQEKFDEILKEAEEEAEKKRLKNEEDLKKVDILFEKDKNILLEKAFNKFILDKDD